ncbi:MAG: hypothetical protein ACI3XS_06800 [Eubacteriales bacterium]
MKNGIKEKIYEKLDKAKAQNKVLINSLKDRRSLTDYGFLMKSDGEKELWADAFQAAIDEHEIVVIPARKKPYYIEKQIVIPSNRRIEANGATIRQTPDCSVLMLRNSNTADGTHRPICDIEKNYNISIDGGRWEEMRSARSGYGKSGKYDEERSFFGVSSLFFFNNMENLTLTNITFAHTAGFSVQAGDIKNAVFENIRFESCYADGLHINGNTKNLICRNVSGEVGDDLVALNVYDWQNSSVDFGPMDTVLCENLELSKSSGYKALRIEPGRYYFDDGSEIDCSLKDAIIKNVKGIRTFKMYYQTPGYNIGEPPERGDVGSADNLFFENIKIDLCDPIDKFPPYVDSDPVRGSFAAFEIGANIGYLCLENIDLTLYKENFPYSYLVCCGPKSVRIGNYEVFDPYLSSKVKTLELKNITVNKERVQSVSGIVREIEFDDVNEDGHSTARGSIEEIILDGKKVNSK